MANTGSLAFGQSKARRSARTFASAALVLAVGLLLTLTLCGAAAAAAPNYITTELTNNNEINGVVRISDSRMAWETGTDSQIFTWTPSGGAVQLTSNPHPWYVYSLEVSGDRIVWTASNGDGSQQIFTWTPAGGIVNVPSAGYFKTDAQVSGDRIVWSEYGGTGDDIFTWTPAGGLVQITNTADDDENPQVSGDRIVWDAFDGSYRNIFTWTPDGGVVRLTNESAYDDEARVSGDRIIWRSDHDSNSAIFTWTPSGGTHALALSGYNYSGQVSGDRVVWRAPSPTGVGDAITTWTPSGGFVSVTSDSNLNWYPQVSGDLIVWERLESSIGRIATWTPSGGMVQLTFDPYHGENPVVSGTTVAWQGTPINGGSYEIFRASPAAQIAGGVEGTDGTALGGAQVTVALSPSDSHYDSGNAADNIVGTATTGADGTYAIETAGFRGTGLATGSTINVTASLAGYQNVTQSGAYSRAQTICDFQAFNTMVGGAWEDRRLPTTGTAHTYSRLLPAYLGAIPSVTSVADTSGPTGGGATVTITGSGFTGVTGPNGVTFGGANALSYTVDSDTKITAQTAAHARGDVRLSVNGGGGATYYSSSCQYTYVAPTISDISPSSGYAAGGTSVTIHGRGFARVTGANGVSFGGTNAASFTVDSDTQITAVSPSHAPGQVGLKVSDPGDSASIPYTFLVAPTISSIDPTTGLELGGDNVTIEGTGFTGATGVTFGSVNATSYRVYSDSTITAKAPPHAIGTAYVHVVGANGPSLETDAAKYTYTVAPPVVSALTPGYGPASGGTTVLIEGSHFVGLTGADAVMFGDFNAASYTVLSDTQISAVTPAHVCGVVKVKIRAMGGATTLDNAPGFTYTPVGGASDHFVTTRITNNAWDDGIPRVSGDRIVWSAIPDGSDLEVYTWTPTSGIVRLTTNSKDDEYPMVSGDRVVWSGTGGSDGGADYEIFTWTPSGGTVQLTKNSKDDRFAQVSGGRIVWMEAQTTDNQNYDIYTWTSGTGVVKVTTSTNDDLYPSVSGDRIAWINTQLTTGLPETWTPGSGIVVIDTVPAATEDFALTANNRVAVHTTKGVDTWTTGGRTLLDGTGMGIDMGISGDRIIWDATNLGAGQIFTWTPAEGITQVSRGVSDASYEGVSGSRVVWEAADGGLDNEVYTWTPTTGPTQITNNSLNDWGPVVSGNRLAWVEDLTDTNGEIYTATLTTAAVPTISSLTPSHGPTTGFASVVISGSGFTGITDATGVTFGGVNATSYTVDSDTQITAVAPAHTAGMVNVQVNGLGGSTADSAADDFTYVTAAHYEETDGRIVFAPTTSWASYASTSSSGGAYMRANASGSSVTVYFNGERLDWIAMKGTTTGKADVYLDDVLQGAVDLAASAATYQVNVWSTGSITNGLHKVKISWNTGNAAGKYITVDAFNVIGSLVYAPPAIASLSPASGALAGGTSVTINGTGFGDVSSVTFGGASVPFTVVSPTKITATAPAHAAGSVSVQVTTASGSASSSFTYSAAPPTTRVDLPATTTVGLTTSGTWAAYSSTSAYGSSYLRSSTAGASVVVTFKGTRLDWITLKGTTGAKADIYVDGSPTAAVTALDLYTSPAVYQQNLWSTGTLADGYHTVKIVRSASSASGRYLTLDAVEIAGTLQAPTRLEETSPAFTFTPAWTVGSTTSASAGAYRYTNTKDASVRFSFTGVGFKLIAKTAASYGNLLVTIDSGTAQTVSLYSSATTYKKVVLTAFLAPGIHTVTIARAGTKSSSSTGYTVDLDAIDLFGAMN